MNFDYSGYPLTFVQKQACNDKSAHLFTIVYKFFSPVTGLIYIIRAEYHEEDVFAIKFYCKKDRGSKYKYSKIINKGDIGNILISCLLAVPALISEYPTASFAFAGARSIDFKSKKRKVEGYQKTQRFRVYREIVAKHIGEETFAHFEFEEVSAYLLLNRYYEDIGNKKDVIARMFADTYEDLIDI